MLRNGLEPWHVVVVVLVVFLLFGAKRLPDTARALGKSLRILKSETKALKDDFKEGAAGEPAEPRAQDEPARRTIQSAPGDVASARPVEEPRRAHND